LRHGVPADQLTVEVTESATMADPERAIRVLDALRTGGAEGIETQDVLDRLSALGCDEGQGYLISRPSTAEQLSARRSSGPGAAGAARRRPARSGALAASRGRV
jgi:EAL domain-containing protein (putative c-di-GMP-specific phosphodiesterase class I)